MQGSPWPLRPQARHSALKCSSHVLAYTCQHACACSIVGAVLRCLDLTLATVMPCFKQARGARLRYHGRTGHLWMQVSPWPRRPQARHSALKCHASLSLYTQTHAHAYSSTGGVLQLCTVTLASVGPCSVQARRRRLQDPGRTDHLWMQGLQLPFRAQSWHSALKCRTHVLVYMCALAAACSIFRSVRRCCDVRLSAVPPDCLHARRARPELRWYACVVATGFAGAVATISWAYSGGRLAATIQGGKKK